MAIYSVDDFNREEEEKEKTKANSFFIDIGKYEALYVAGSQCEDENTPYAKQVLKLLEPWRPTKILDVGCGTGFHTRWFNENGYDCIGITNEKWEIEKKVHPNVQFGNIYKIPFGEKQFDLVFCLGTIEHIFAPFIAMCEFNRVLKDKGYLFIDTPNLAANYVFEDDYYYHKSVLFPIQMKDLFKRTKFKMLDCEKFKMVKVIPTERKFGRLDGGSQNGVFCRYAEEIILNPDGGNILTYLADGLGIYLVQKTADLEI